MIVRFSPPLPSILLSNTLMLQDCPELTLAAIQKSIKESYPGSEIFVFTDASKYCFFHLNILNIRSTSEMVNLDCTSQSILGVRASLYPFIIVWIISIHSIIEYDCINPINLPGSKEVERKEVIIEEATRKRIKVNFVLTGHCGDNQMEDQAIYHEISDATSGFVSSLEFSIIFNQF